jgi:hypothetical protein
MIVGFRLSLRRLSDNRLALTIPLAFRLLLLAFGLVLIFALLTTSPVGVRGIFVTANTIPLAVCALCLFGASYRESWTFDRQKNTLTSLAGILFIQRRRNWALAELARLELGQFIRGRPYAPTGTKPGLLARPILTLTLHTTEGNSHRLEMYSFTQRNQVGLYARKIADYCGIPYLDLTEGVK